MMIRTRRGIAVVAMAASALMVGATAANAASGTWSSSGKTGVHAQGTWKTEYSKLYISGYVKDTACDGHAVSLKITFSEYYAAGLYGKYRTETVTNNGGCGSSKSFSYNTYKPGKTILVNVSECIVDGGLGSIDSCTGSNVINTKV